LRLLHHAGDTQPSPPTARRRTEMVRPLD
jgi:hypothetical protein